MKKAILILVLGLLWCGSVIASEEKLWKHGDDYLTPQCFVYEWSSGDNFEEYFNRYSPAVINAYGRQNKSKIQILFFDARLIFLQDTSLLVKNLKHRGVILYLSQHI